MDAEAALAVGLGRFEATQSRLTVRPHLKARIGKSVRAETVLRLEAAGSDTGLGTVATFADASRPLALGPDARASVESATLAWRKRSTRVTVGKQTVAWGVLDGLQVTDRASPVRRREAVFAPQRPDRLARWGARAEFKRGETRYDAVVFGEGTADQLAIAGDTYAVRAPRLRAGLPASAPQRPVPVAVSSEATVGLRAQRRLGGSDVSALVLSGPETEPVIELGQRGPQLSYPERTLIGATWQRGDGARVWRVEGAVVPDQPINLRSASPLVERRLRVLLGAGADWDLPDGVFANVQLAADHVAGRRLLRPSTDVVATVRVQKPLRNDTMRVSAELLGTLTDGDGAFRPALAWQLGENYDLELGADLVWGPRGGLIGQFRETDRLYMRARWRG